MASYEFLLSSLPALLYKTGTALSQNEFFDRVIVSLTETEMNELRAVTLSPDIEADSNLEVIREWYSWEKSLRSILAKNRASAKSMESGIPSSFAAEHSELSEVVKQIMSIDNPLTAEEAIDEARFNFLDTLSCKHFFDKSSLFLYKLKLDLVQRKMQRVEEKGRTAFTSVYNQVLSGFDRKGNNGENQ